MKKIVLSVVAIVIVGMSSCKKEESAQPELKGTVRFEKKDTTQWD